MLCIPSPPSPPVTGTVYVPDGDDVEFPSGPRLSSPPAAVPPFHSPSDPAPGSGVGLGTSPAPSFYSPLRTVSSLASAGLHQLGVSSINQVCVCVWGGV